MLILNNLRIYPGYGSRIFKGSIVIENQKILDIVSEENENVCLRYPNTTAVDMRGLWAGPAFTDSHVHLTALATSMNRLKLDGMNRVEILRVLAESSENLSEDLWIRGRGWERQFWDAGTGPTKKDIDPITQNHPTALFSKDGHTLLLNSRALELLEIHPWIDDPPGGKFDRFDDGSLTGVVRENAVEWVRERLPDMHINEKKNAILKAISHCHELGITTIHTFEQPDDWTLIRSLFDENDIPMKILVYLPDKYLDTVLDYHLSCSSSDEKEMKNVRLKGVKLFADGALGSQTALLTEPYLSSPDNYGLEVSSVEQMTKICLKAAEHHVPCAIHAIGDKAVANAVSAQTAAKKRNPELQGARIEHLQLIASEDINRMAQYHIIASVQPFHLLSDYNMVLDEWIMRPQLKYPYKTIWQKGIPEIFGSDAPIDEMNPFKIMAAAVQRAPDGVPVPKEIAEERLSLEEAYAAVSEYPTIAEGDIWKYPRGRLETGRFADILILKEDPFEVSMERLSRTDIQVLISRGKVVFGHLDKI